MLINSYSEIPEMASTRSLFIILTVAATFVPSILAADIIVGGDKGWTLDVNYQEWADGMKFYVGDKLIFNYNSKNHNVADVPGPFFQNCTVPANVQPLTTGNDEITLSTTGRKWYICGFGNHCASRQMKFVITVLDEAGAPLSPPDSAAPVGTAVSIYSAFMAVLAGFVVMIVA